MGQVTNTSNMCEALGSVLSNEGKGKKGCKEEEEEEKKEILSQA